MTDIKRIFGKRLKQLRQLQELTQQELAERAEMSISFLSSIERGLKSPTIETLEKLADALGVTLSELLSFDSGAKILEDERQAQVRYLLAEYTKRIENLFQE